MEDSNETQKGDDDPKQQYEQDIAIKIENHKEQQNCELSINNVANKDNNCETQPGSKTAIQMQNFENQLAQTISELTLNSSNTLKQHKTSVSEKLDKARHHLQLKKSDLDCNIDKAEQHDTIVKNILKLMSNKEGTSIEAKTPSLPQQDTRTKTKDFVSEDYQSKEHLEAVVEGFQQLISQIISNDRKFLNVFSNAVKKIRVLKDLPFFECIRRERRELSRIEKQRNCFEFLGEESNQRGTSSKMQNSIRKEKEPKIPEINQNHDSEIIEFADYINKMLRQHLGDKKELEKYKCLPENLDDLESFAKSLVEEGYGTIVEAKIRINRKNRSQGFISVSNNRETDERDGIVELPVARRYALDEDIVRAFILNENSLPNTKNIKSPCQIEEESSSLFLDESKTDDTKVTSSNESENISVLDASIVPVKKNSRKSFVIKIVKQIEPRDVVGLINFNKLTLINSKEHYQLRPRDLISPMVFIPKELCEEDVYNTITEDLNSMIYVVRILHVDANGLYIGEILDTVGKKGNVQAEIKSILMQNGLKNLKPYESKYQEMFEGPMPKPSDEDLKNREDLRKICVFTIDPLTAKDLDDAISIEEINDNEYEIGVHISDVTYFLPENSELDNLVKCRSTSVYLVNEVIHMLPKALCLRCSLLPGEDKFAFSVFWRWNKEKKELSAPRMTRSIINSCSQFAYEHVQNIIDNPNKELQCDDLPDLLHQWSPNDIKWRVLLLHGIAQTLKAKRFENGAISINNPKMRIKLNPDTGEAITYELEARQEANYLIEELMLLANQSVAKFIYECFPEKSILRHHGPPLKRVLKSIKERLNIVGLDIDITSSKSIYESLQHLTQNASDPLAVETGLNALLTKTMARARYFCSEGITSEADFLHYALSIPMYTHFTSPIRRYPDIMVHRLLAAALSYCPPPERTSEELHRLAEICNDQKLNAKNAGDQSIELFFKRYLKDKGAIILDAVVTELGNHSTNVVTSDTGHSFSISHKLQKCFIITEDAPRAVHICEKSSGNPPTMLQLFSRVKIKLIFQSEQMCASFATLKEQEKPEVLRKSLEDTSWLNFDEDKPPNLSKTSKRRKARNKKKMKDDTFLSFYAIKD